MKTLAKLALGAAMVAGAATMVAVPADAAVSFGIGIGVPGPYYGRPYYPYRPRYSCDPYSRWYDPYYCGAYAPAYVYGPSFYYSWHDGWRGGRDRDRGRDRDDFRGDRGRHGR